MGFYGLIVGCFMPCFGMFGAMFVASIGRILWPVDKGCYETVSGSNIGLYWSCQGALWHAGAWKPCYCVVGCILGYTIAWVFHAIA